MRQVFNWGAQQAGQEQAVQLQLQLESLKFQLNRALKDKVLMSEKYNQARQSNQGMVQTNQKLRAEFYSMQEQLKVKSHDIGAFRSSTVAKLVEHNSLLKDIGEECKKIVQVEQKTCVFLSRLAEVELQMQEMALQVQKLVMNFGQLAHVVQQNNQQDAQSSPGGCTPNLFFTPSTTMQQHYCSQLEQEGRQTKKRKRIRVLSTSTHARVIREQTEGPVSVDENDYTCFDQAQHLDNLLSTDAQDVFVQPQTCNAQLLSASAEENIHPAITNNKNNTQTQLDTIIQTERANNGVNLRQNGIKNGCTLQAPNLQVQADLDKNVNFSENGYPLQTIQLVQDGQNVLDELETQKQMDLSQNDAWNTVEMDLGGSKSSLKRPPSCLQRTPQQFTKEPRLSTTANAINSGGVQSLQQAQALCQTNTQQAQLNLLDQGNFVGKQIAHQQGPQQPYQQQQLRNNDCTQPKQQLKCSAGTDSSLQLQQPKQQLKSAGLVRGIDFQQQEQQQKQCIVASDINCSQQQLGYVVNMQQQLQQSCGSTGNDDEGQDDGNQAEGSSSLLEELTPMRGGDIQKSGDNDESSDEFAGDVLRSARHDVCGQRDSGNVHGSSEFGTSGQTTLLKKDQKTKQGTQKKPKSDSKQLNEVTSKKKKVNFVETGNKDSRQYSDKIGFRESSTSDSEFLKQQGGSQGRTRRQRSTVNYAEPKLNTKLQKGDKIISQGIPKQYIAGDVEVESSYYSKKKNSNIKKKKI